MPEIRMHLADVMKVGWFSSCEPPTASTLAPNETGMATKDEASSPSCGRPTYHFQAPRGWMNDPCAPGFDPETGLYHLFYQWNPHSHFWDNISWGHATSRDLVSWKHSSDKPVFVPDQPYDDKGIYTGCFYSAGPSGEKGQLSVFYTSVNHLPIMWDQPYARGCESIAVAFSSDGGKRWQKDARNPCVREEPPDLHVTGFRDPFVSRWPSMDAKRGTADGIYGVVSGGIHNQGPRVFLYSLDPNTPTRWSYLHPLTVDLNVNAWSNTRWSKDLGANWECVSFASLSADDGQSTREVLMGGCEGVTVPTHISLYHATHPKAPRRTPRSAFWSMGQLQPNSSGEVRMTVDTLGCLDWGLYYAAAKFTAKDGRTLLHGWIIEEDLNDATLAAKGWTGCLGVPREVFLMKVDDVIGALKSPLESIGFIETTPKDDSGTCSVLTLGMRPIKDITCLRMRSLFDARPEGPDSLSFTAPLACEINLVVAITDRTKGVVLTVREDKTEGIRTKITFDCGAETLVVDRCVSTAREDINKVEEVAPFTLFRTIDRTGLETLEKLQLRVFLDYDVIEVFANDRCAISTRVYSPPEARGVTLECIGGDQVEVLQAWEMGTIYA